MWTISEVKEEGKNTLRTCFWPSVGTCFVFTLLAGGTNMITSRTGGNNEELTEALSHRVGDDLSPALILAIVGAILGVILLAGIIGILWSVFLTNVISVGYVSYFIKARDDSNTSIAVLFDMFKSGRYMNVCKVMFMKKLYIFLWSLLFVIPGIIKAYEYFMVDYILAENPNMDYRDALALSKATMDGEKMNVFVLSLSFIGWILLSAFTCGLLMIFYVNPYMCHTMAATYLKLKDKAIDMGYATLDDFCEA